jgi:selenocysteine lyase/cysteine desulfurase
VFASPPAVVRNAIATHQASFDHNPIEYLHANEGRFQTAIRMAAADYLGTRADEIAFTDSTTMGLGLVYHGLRLKPGEEILTTEHDFYSTHEALRLRAQRDGVTVRRVRLYADPAKASVDEIVSNVDRALSPATKLVAMTWVHSGTGVKLPVREITNAVKGRALVSLDSVHGFGAQDAGPPELGVDFLISGCHKWLFGPRGTGIIWGSARGVVRLPASRANVRQLPRQRLAGRLAGRIQVVRIPVGAQRGVWFSPGHRAWAGRQPCP